MPVEFTIKTKAPGRGSAATHANGSRQASDAVSGELEYAVGKAVVSALGKAVQRTNSQKIYIAATFFQWVVSRTPVDEEYLLPDGTVHEPDDDSVRDEWFMAYGRLTICSADFPGCFDTFNDQSAISRIADTLQRGITTSRNIRTFRVYNTNPRFSELEYGEYRFTSGAIKAGPKRRHGVQGGFSVQAPRGMLRLTEAELGWISSSAKNRRGLMAKAQELRNQKMVPDKRRTKAIYNHLKGKRRVKESDLEWLK